MSKVVIVGGGAAGMMAAVSAAQMGHQVILYEKNEKLGKKIYITGKGRCNVTNACDIEKLFQAVNGNSKFLYSAFYGFDNSQVMAFFEENGCPLKIERGERVFPVSDHASDVIFALQRCMKELGVEVNLHTPVTEICLKKNEDGKDKVSGVKLKNKDFVEADSVIIATGGLSYPTTGSTGDGYEFAESTGHLVTDRKPSLVPLVTSEKWCHELMGLSLKNVEVSLYRQGKEIYRDFGEMLFTHFGISGPLILSASAQYVEKAWNEKAEIFIDLKPALDEEQLDKRLLREFEENKNKQFKNAVGGLFPSKLTPVMIMLSGIDPEKKVNEITKKERKDFVNLIKKLPLTVIGCRDYNEAIITKGGVSVKEINPSTMESKKVKGLYFAGEVLDLDAVTGGFNLQIAWSTGSLAGSSIQWE
ncbi:MAG: NAD(P)/FAD-dependent oxidoreductase [Lachnospiraceae bacterium]|nr:NAD(P)/FAD-dependent oxidoreductase [Lachnospiraceae bacterium]